MHHGSLVLSKMASSDSDSSYEVDQILNQRKRKGVLEYLVRWRGFGKAEDSWEPGKNLSNCAAAMAEYLKITAAPKTPKKSSRSKSRSRSRSRSRTTKTKSSRSRTPRARSRTPRARSSTPRSRSRSSSRGRITKVTKESPSRQAKKTEVVTRTSTNREPGRLEKKTEIVRHTTVESKPTEVKTTRVVQSRLEVKTVEDKVDGKALVAKSEGGIAETLHTLWETADTAVLILFVCISIIALSYVVENYCSPSDMWKYVVGLYTAVVGAIAAFFQAIAGATGRLWETTANFTRESWKKVTTN